jgi:hypothetical protein
MAQEGKKMRVGSCEGFARLSVKLVQFANDNWYGIDSSIFLVVKPLSIQSFALSQL